jgi:hypothetical protein
MRTRPLRYLGGLLLLSLSLTSCGWMAATTTSQQTEETIVQIKSLSQIFLETGVMSCTKVDLRFGPYAQFTALLAGRTTWDQCLRIFNPY